MPKTRHTYAEDDQDAERYFDMFCGYAKAELHTRGPDQHLELAVQFSHSTDYPAWFIGCYMGPYDVPSGIAIFNDWEDPYEIATMSSSNEEALTNWLRDHWSELRIRKERRPCRAPHKMAEYLVSYAKWCTQTPLDSKSFEELWQSFEHIRYVGRYAGMRIAEALGRSGLCPDGFIKDIRAGDGGWSPRHILSCFDPDNDALLNAPATKKTTDAVEKIGKEWYERSQEILGPFSFYNFESLLCNFRQGLEARRYPGHALDNDLEAIKMIAENFGIDSDTDTLFGLRKELYPHECLGELQGWSGYRDELSLTYRNWGVWWDDTVYDYKQSSFEPTPRRLLA